MDNTTYFKVKLLKKTTIAESVVEFVFEKPDGYNFVAGQFVQFRIPVNGGVIMRSYSISVLPTEGRLQFCIKIIPTGQGSSYLNSLGVGEEAEISAPKGFFGSKKEVGNKYFIATGVGLTPIITIIENENKEANGEKMHLLFGVREEKDIFWQDRLQKQTGEKFSFDITLSRPSEDWQGLKGRVTDHIKIDLAGHYYICGNVNMVKDVRTLLVSNGLNTKSIHMEIF